MNIRHPFRFALELLKRDGTALGQVPVAADWEPAVEAARFIAHRRLGLAAIGTDAVVEFRPAWHAKLGEPYVSALDVVLSVPGHGGISARVPTTFFKSLASAASAPLVKKGLLETGEHFDYLVTAFADSSLNPAVEPRARFALEEVTVPLTLKASSLAEFLDRAVECGPPEPQDIPVFIPRHVLDEADALTRQSPAIEVAAVLIGHLHRDEQDQDLFLEVTAQVPARNSQGTALKVTFGPDTYHAVQNALTLRGAGEQWVGWFHSHPASSWCNPKCPPEVRAQCSLQRTFFSADDCDVHRTLFPKAFNIALLVTNTDAGLQHALFAWRNGIIMQRSFHILGLQQKPEPNAAPVTAATIGDNEHDHPCPE